MFHRDTTIYASPHTALWNVGVVCVTPLTVEVVNVPNIIEKGIGRGAGKVCSALDAPPQRGEFYLIARPVPDFSESEDGMKNDSFEGGAPHPQGVMVCRIKWCRWRRQRAMTQIWKPMRWSLGKWAHADMDDRFSFSP